jgi:tRNA-dihydrouridine synthase
LADSVEAHLEASLAFYPHPVGLRMFRKHLAAYVEAASWRDLGETARAARARLCRLETPAEVRRAVRALWPARKLAA